MVIIKLKNKLSLVIALSVHCKKHSQCFEACCITCGMMKWW